MKITLDLSTLSNLVKTADKIVFSPEGEETLVNLITIQKQVEDALDNAKLIIESAALKQDPNFMSVQGDKVKVSYRSYGARFKIDESFISQIPENLYTKKTNYTPIPEAVEKHAAEKGMPLGIIEPERKKQIIITAKK